MANHRVFTYNNGSVISGTEQIGDLAVGVSLQDYATRIGGKTWWGGPDETNKYIIAKDVPTQDKSTPIGNIGSVRFWRCDRVNADFISLVNALGDQSFTNVDDCLDWLSTNGYWSNYPIDTDSASDGKVRYYNTQVGGGTYLGNREAIYSGVQNRIYASDLQSYNVKVNPSNFTTGDEDLSVADGDYDTWSGILGTFTLNAAESFLYQGFTNPSNTVRIRKINTSTLATAEEYVESITVDNINGPQNIIYVSASDKVVMSHLNKFNNPGYISPAITVWDEDLNIESTRINVPNNYNALSPHSTNSTFLWYDAGNSQDYWVSDTEDLTTIYTGSLPTGVGAQFGWYQQPPINHPTNNDWYITGTYIGNQTAMFIIDGDTYEVKQVVPLPYITNDNINNDQPPLAYDSNRDVIWTFTSQRELVAFDCNTNKVVKTIPRGNIDIVGTFTTDRMTVDTTNNLLYSPNVSPGDYKVDLNKIWPI